MTRSPKRYQIFFAELKRRHVFRVAAVYGIVAFAVMQAADFLVPALLLPETVASGIALVAILGFPIALVLAWAFEVTPDGMKRANPAASAELQAIVAQPISSRLSAGWLALAGTALLVGGVWWVFRDAGHTGGEIADSVSARSIAVLPFVNMSGDPENEYFSDGLAEELINVLTKIEGLKVAARTSAFSFKGKNTDAREIGEALGVGNLLEGSVRKSGDQVRITAQLIQTSDGFHLWSETYDRQLDDIFAIQDEIAEAIAAEMQLTLGTETRPTADRRPTDDLAAYDLFLLGRHNWVTRSESGLIAARRYIEQAIERDSTFARAWAGLAGVYNALPWWTDFPKDEAVAKGKAAALRAIELDPQSSEAYAVLATTMYEFDWEWAEAEIHFKRALALDPDYNAANLWYCQFLFYTGRTDEALGYCEHGLAFDPLSLLANFANATLYAYRGQFDEAFAFYEQAEEIEPAANVLIEHAGMLALIGRYSDAAEVYERWAEVEGLQRPELAREIVAGMADEDRRQAALEALEKLQADTPVDPFNWIAPLVRLGETERAVALVERIYEERNPSLLTIGTDPRFDPLRRDPRFIRIIEEMGLPNGGPTYR